MLVLRRNNYINRTYKNQLGHLQYWMQRYKIDIVVKNLLNNALFVPTPIKFEPELIVCTRSYVVAWPAG